MIRVTGLNKNYAAFPALREVSFEVASGEVVGFLGPNGAGKTTTLRILSGYMPSTSGRVEVAGFDVASRSREVRRRTGYLPEDVPLYRDLTVEAYLRYVGGLKEIPGGRIAAETERVIRETGLEPVRGRLVGKCSKGYRQRTGLAQALLGNPSVLLLDEPTSGLDPNQVVEVRDLIRTLSGEKTVLLSSHILPEVAQICTRVLIINEGRIVGSGSPGELGRRTAGRSALHLRVRGDLRAERLRSLPGILDAHREPGDAARWVLAVDDGDLAAPGVAREVVASGAELLELRQEAVDLESVFRRLTRGDGDA